MPAPEFAAYISPARHSAQLWRLLLGLCLILLIYAGFISLVLVLLYPILGPLNYFGWILQLANPTEPWPTIVLLVTFIGLALGTIVAAPACHYRSPGTLFGPLYETLRGFLLTVALLIPVYGVVLALTWMIATPEPNLPPGLWARMLPLALPLLLIQVSAEELFFRGYLPQQLAARFGARWIWMGLPALCFALLHYNPEAGANAWLIVATTLVYALIAADITEHTGSLGAAIGLHFVNNFSALLLVSVKGTITGLALFVTPYGLSDVAQVPLGVAIDVGLLILVWRLLRATVCR